jgi:threonine dehydrogenase-like Zn-dependent dehydrogenase
VFTQAVLEELDEKAIKPTFMLPDITSLEDLAEITQEMSTKEEEEEADILATATEKV